MSEEKKENVLATDIEITQPLQVLDIDKIRQNPAGETEEAGAGRTWLLLLIVLVPMLGFASFLTIRAGTIEPGLPLFCAALGYIGGFVVARIFQKK